MHLMYEGMLKFCQSHLNDVPNIRERRKRNVVAIEKEWYKIKKGVMDFACFFHRVENMNLNGNVTFVDRISAAKGLSCSIDLYEAIKKERAADKAHVKRRKRAANEAECEYVP